MQSYVHPTAALWDWRRRVTDLYAEIRLSSEPSIAWRRWRQTRDTLFGRHSQSPLDEAGGFSGLAYYDYDPDFRFFTTLAPIADAPVEIAPAGADGVVHLTPFARTVGLVSALGGELFLYWVGGYGGGVLLPFTDATNSRETYGGGRYLLDTIKGADLGSNGEGQVVLDFNFAYFPSCAYSQRWVCPLPPPSNRLPARVTAGERLP
jgi:uncharacterized protein (DUF1684 family)